MRKFDAKKVEMSQVFAEDGKAVPVTYIKAEAIPDDLTVGATVKATGISKGKGFQGVVKRWHFAGGPKTHGQSDRWRAPGSIGMRTTPGRVWKGKKMPGRMGNEKVSVRNLKIVAIDKEKGVIAVSGAVPGARNGRIVISY